LLQLGKESDGTTTTEPVYFRNDYAGTEYATVEGHFGAVLVTPGEQRRLDGVASIWLGQLRELGFFGRAQGGAEGPGGGERP
jgi:hypothetical protein